MSAAEHQSQNTSPQPSRGKSLKDVPQRPSLLQPPARPAAVQPSPAPVAVPSVVEENAKIPLPKDPPSEASSSPMTRPSLHPIPPPSEPMQYRAIGLIRGVYQPSEAQLNRGVILADDGAVIESVLLGRITSLIKKHLDLSAPHLWVVYPRTRQPQEDGASEEVPASGLHAQIVGVWEPETLGMPGENPHLQEANDGNDMEEEQNLVAPQTPEEDQGTAPEAPIEAVAALPTSEGNSAPQVVATKENAPLELPSENYFSIRGEVLSYDDESGQIVVKILQGAKQPNKPPKAFRLTVLGHISGKTVGYFWELDVARQGEQLVLVEGKVIALVPPKKKKKKRGKPPGGRGGRRPDGVSPLKPVPSVNKEKPRIRPPAPVKSNPL